MSEPGCDMLNTKLGVNCYPQPCPVQTAQLIPNQRNCVPRLRYVQPPRVQSFKPITIYKQPTLEMEIDTIYKNSYAGFSSENRAKMIKPENQLGKNTGTMDTRTTQALSFPGHFCTPTTKPIIPCSPSLLGEGAMQGLTTQKHDYVPKPYSKRKLIFRPTDHTSNVPLSSETVHRLSFLKPEPCGRTQSCKPLIIYKQPELEMDIDTTQKLSFLPICIPKKEYFPWAQKSKYCAPNIPTESETTYKLSYPSNCGDHRRAPYPPQSNQKMIGSDIKNPMGTVYQDSYFYSRVERSAPVRPIAQLSKTDAPMEGNTCYSLSYPGHCGMERTAAIRPCAPSLLLEGPMQDVTTQKHDYVFKPYCKRDAILQSGNLKTIDAPFEKESIARLSYLTPCVKERTKSFKPIVSYAAPEVPMESWTTQKLSFTPVQPPAKECYPWAIKSKFQMPTLKMDLSTIQNLSYGPPGCFIDESDGCTEVPKIDNYPRAGIVN